MKITRSQLRRIVREAFDTKLSRARSKGNLPDARPDEKRASRRAERRHGDALTRQWDIQRAQSFAQDPAWDSDADTNNPDDVTSQDMADAKRYASEQTPVAMAKYLGISVDDWYRIRQELDDHYEDRHMEDQMAFDHYPGEGVGMQITESGLRRIINEELSRILIEVTLPNKTVRYDRGTNVRDSVKQIQAALEKLKAWDGGQTGKFDKDLRRALRKWQGSAGLGPDGVYGKNTKAKMEEELGKLKGEDPKPEEDKGEDKPSEKPGKAKASEEGLRPVVAGGKDPKRIAYLKHGREWKKGEMTFKRLGGVKKILSDLKIQAVQQGKRAWQDGDDVAQVILWLKKWDQPKPFRAAMKAGAVKPEDVTQIVIKVGRKGMFKVAQDIDTKQPGIIKRLLPLITKMLNV